MIRSRRTSGPPSWASAAGDRVLVDAGAYPDPVDWLLAPLVAGAQHRAVREPRPGQASQEPYVEPRGSPVALA